MNRGYDACRLLYRTARTQESSSSTDRRAVRVALATAIATGLQVATAGAASASASAAAPLATVGVASTVSVGASGLSTGATAIGTTAVGAKGILELLVGGKFLSGLLVGAVLGTAVTTTALVVQPKATAAPDQIQQARTNAARRVAIGPKSVREITARGQSNPEGREGIGVAPIAVSTLPSESRVEARALEGTVASVVAPSRRAPDSNMLLASEARRMPHPRGLVEETQALASVQLALNERDPVKALALIESQERQFPTGQLAEERAAARIFALCAAGRIAQADDARSHFQLAYPNSPLAKRVANGCDR